MPFFSTVAFHQCKYFFSFWEISFITVIKSNTGWPHSLVSQLFNHKRNTTTNPVTSTSGGQNTCDFNPWSLRVEQLIIRRQNSHTFIVLHVKKKCLITRHRTTRTEHRVSLSSLFLCKTKVRQRRPLVAQGIY